VFLQSAADKKQTAQMAVAKSDFLSQMRWSRSDLIKKAERFARIDLDRSRFEKERIQTGPDSILIIHINPMRSVNI